MQQLRGRRLGPLISRFNVESRLLMGVLPQPNGPRRETQAELFARSATLGRDTRGMIHVRGDGLVVHRGSLEGGGS